jgi:hypothetical protein
MINILKNFEIKFSDINMSTRKYQKYEKQYNIIGYPGNFRIIYSDRRH